MSGTAAAFKGRRCGGCSTSHNCFHAIEVPKLITNTAHEYQDLAVELASDPRKLKFITANLQENRLTSGLFDPVETPSSLRRHTQKCIGAIRLICHQNKYTSTVKVTKNEVRL